MTLFTRLSVCAAQATGGDGQHREHLSPPLRLGWPWRGLVHLVPTPTGTCPHSATETPGRLY